ncbi:cation acetate symporter [Cryobacterium sp. MDB1-18-2]|uniref:Cation acetate symporter n=2 Tax=Microbacteriaceae TaxID=85023 RepID=A0ABY2IK11_9MICO|nr:cation acetate symporter [Cryobacterium sp. MDB2-A-1]TFC08932.1 cation acetate symporter [Cryobacterium sp. MDB2-A-2]TFC10873.1 cation acetate symporter [Cryobacterium sp. MDB2-33-2]TFC18599.1 cation acetate symporter [Cryobacterium glucosi]TFC19326.1 cation acetate symporter [Cryobacterium sp. MDB2-10]TFC24059.1 cation acetate symporter [Cryobacterium sp. MDB1-18-2]TFC39374.1 cation acetate symporter [Cryobacterium sp. MDB1-18-1]
MIVQTAVKATETNPVLNISIFLAFVAVTLIVVIRAGRNNRSAADYYTGGRSFTGPQNGFAIAGDYLSAASFLGIVGAIAISGYDGFLYSIGFLVAWLVALLLVAELMRNTGKYTMADVLSFRLKQGPVRVAAATTTLAVCFFYLLAQMAGAGGLVSLLLGINDKLGQSVVVVVVGGLMILYVLIGGMKGTTWVQIIKAFLLIIGALGMTIWVLAINGFNFSGLLDSAVAASISKPAEAILVPGLKYGHNPLDFISLAIALVLGTAGLPHVLMRFYTVPSAKEARRSVVWAIWLIGAFYLFTLVLGFGAAALVGADVIAAAPGGVNSAAPLLSLALGGPLLLGFISAIAFATILAVVAGITITAATSFAHDIYMSVIKKGKGDPDSEVKVARRTVIVIGILAIAGGIGVQGQNIAFLVALAFAVAASANLPTILYSLFWRGFTTRGAVWSMYGGLAAAMILIIFSPVFSGTPTSMFGAGVNFAWFPLSNPGIVSIPIGFFLGWLGSVTSTRKEDPLLAAEMSVRSLTGHGAEKAVEH